MLRRIIYVKHGRHIKNVPNTFDGQIHSPRTVKPVDDRTEWKRNRLASYGPSDTIVLFSGKRLNFRNIGHQFWQDGSTYADILEAASKSYGKYVFKHTDFRALSTINLAMNLCAYRQFYEENPVQFNSVKSAVGFGLGELAALVVSGAIDTQDAFEIINYHSNEVEKLESKRESTVAVIKTKKSSKIELACHEAREYVAKVNGFDLEDTLLIPQHESYGVATTE